MLDSFTGMLSKIKNTKLMQNISDNYQKIKQTVRRKIPITPITPNIFHISFPEQATLQDLKLHIADNQFQIWNISEYRYQPTLQTKILQHKQKGQMHHLCFQYYSNLPLYELIIAINSIHAFLLLSPTNRVYIHCQDNKIRSSIFLACYIYKFSIMDICDVSEAILFVNKRLDVNIQVQQKESATSNYKNIHTFFKNFINYLNNPKIINKNKLQLLKIIVNQAPKIKLANQIIGNGGSLKQMKVGVEIRCKETVIYKGIYDSSVFEGDSLCLQLSKRTIILGDDFLVVLKYIYQSKIYNIMRIQLNTNFILQKFFRAHMQFIDLSAFCIVQNRANMFIDFLFQENLQLSDLAKLQYSPLPQTTKKELQNIPPQKQTNEPTKQPLAESFSLDDHDGQQHQINQTEINLKIQQVLKSINTKQTSSQNHQQQKQEQEEQDLDDYLSKLQSQA